MGAPWEKYQQQEQPKAPLSVRNNNPGNLRPVGAENGFQQFDTPQAGFDAMRQDLLAKVTGNSRAMKAAHGEGYSPTLRNVISVWAPESENNTNNYVNFVAQKSGLNPDAPLTPESVDSIIPAMIEMEGGKDALQHFTQTNPAGKPWEKYASQPEEPQKPTLAGKPQQPKESVNVAEDVVKSGATGALEGVAAATPLGMGLNIVRGASELAHWGGRKLVEGITGEELLYKTSNPVPSSHDVLQGIAKKTEAGGLYEPKTRAGKYANTAASFASGAAALGAGARAVATSIPAAVASEVAGEATEGTNWEIPARVAAALVATGGVNKLVDRVGKVSAPKITADDIKHLSRAKYKQAESSKVQMPASKTDAFLADARKSLMSGDDVIDAMKSSKPMRDVLDDLELFKGQPMTLQRAQALDEQLGDIVDGFTTLGKVNKQGAKILDVQTKFRGLIDKEFSTLKEARQLWADQAKLRDIEKIIERADMYDQPATALKTGFRTLANNKARMNRFTAEEQALIKKAATTGKYTDVVRSLGSRLLPFTTVVAGGGMGATTAATAGSMVARDAAARMQLNRAGKLTDRITSKYQTKTPTTNQRWIGDVKEAVSAPVSEKLRFTLSPRLSDKIRK